MEKKHESLEDQYVRVIEGVLVTKKPGEMTKGFLVAGDVYEAIRDLQEASQVKELMAWKKTQLASMRDSIVDLEAVENLEICEAKLVKASREVEVFKLEVEKMKTSQAVLQREMEKMQQVLEENNLHHLSSEEQTKKWESDKRKKDLEELQKKNEQN